MKANLYIVEKDPAAITMLKKTLEKGGFEIAYDHAQFKNKAVGNQKTFDLTLCSKIFLVLRHSVIAIFITAK
jgi:hypothetical protein